MGIQPKQTPPPASKQVPVSKSTPKAPSKAVKATPKATPKVKPKAPKVAAPGVIPSGDSPPPPKKRPGERRGATKDAPSDAEIEARRVKVSMLLVAHAPNRRIAELVGVSLPTVNRDIAAVKAESRARAGVAMDQHFADGLARLDELGRRLWSGPLAQSHLDMKAFEGALKLYATMFKLLGINRPITLELTGAGGQPLIPVRDDDALLDEIDRLSERLAAMPRRIVPVLPPPVG